jgi:hypothetical protein
VSGKIVVDIGEVLIGAVFAVGQIALVVEPGQFARV